MDAFDREHYFVDCCWWRK